MIDAQKLLLDFLTVQSILMMEEPCLPHETQPVSSLLGASQIGSHATTFVATTGNYASNNVNCGGDRPWNASE